jgi:hypothetical protein
MFEFKFTEEQNTLREMAREFTDNEIKPKIVNQCSIF